MNKKNEKPQKKKFRIPYGAKTAIRRILWLSFFVFVILLFIWSYNLTHGFVMDRDQTNIEELIGEISEENSMRIYIPMGSSTKYIAELFEEEGIIEDARIFTWYSRFMGNDSGYKSGFHFINKHVDYDNPVGYDMLIHIISQNPLSNPTERIFFAEGLTFKQTVERFTKYDFIDEDTLIETAQEADFDYDFIQSIPDDPNRTFRLEGYLFPDTYLFDITQDEEITLKRMLNNFNVKFREIYRNRAVEMDLTIDEVIIIASMIEKEAQMDDERAAIAGVIYNRLKSDDPSLQRLQIDATIQYYFLNETGEVKEELYTRDTEIDHPYNTYRYTGLPPGPICNPGEMSIIAALYPDEHDYYYYVAKGDGYHAFSRTYDEHLANVQRYLN